MKIEQITEQKLTERTNKPIFIGYVDEEHVGMHVTIRWTATTDPQFATQQADKMASDNYEDIVVLAYRDGKSGFDEFYRAKAGRDVEADRAKHKDSGDDFETNW